ncbi:short-chain dehydrogenase/reductase [Amycolatopsis mediterranei S699]|uniref:Predicted short-chain dehydrogenase/reductase n=2 Tax=Amycolatopsis mediterranei TaxID=33910 RepID=A0A0H3D8S9_AMYMU|nr:SDR family NAD(P)-dependent oxidoreductase [Amycolatopsis mediterranei]ADJ47395.1 predicted short-chain dehydrogenase/reductase [Amycolatopsis mediterranei U32]AEK44241.1 short-chain dehydrogenase/reductase [Amycolatopsis mediterranei S699]AFO79106.1 short-chain dehydrogenase/reductase [Amycolatopsis mediterranei S699]AGT86234.1 short-chain dehydrogenase/reductase [Amycolatopsis mediterranei RB]KDO12417.1 short-chain dehydrogenase [Amycolatopsis mediterranei]
MGFSPHADRVVAIVTGGSLPAGRDVARGLARRAWPVVLVYLDHQTRVEATLAEIIAEGGTAIGVRADLADDLDVQRLFTESVAEFGGVDVVVHTTPDSGALLLRHAVRHLRPRSTILVTAASGPITPAVAAQLRERGITVERTAPRGALDRLDGWAQPNGG